MWIEGKQGVDDDLMQDWLTAVLIASRRGVKGEALATTLAELVDHISGGRRRVVVGDSKAGAAPDTTHHDALQWVEGIATTKFGKYTILSVLPGYQLFTPDCAGKHRWVATVTQAKYAAQSDYDRMLAPDANGFIDALRGALEPFANAADHYNACGVGYVIDHEERLTVGDLRLAKAAFETPIPQVYP